MTLDGITLAAIVRELNDIAIGAKIEKIHQPAKDEIVLVLHTTQGKKRVIVSTDAGDCRMHITQRVSENPAIAPNFCMLLRKHIAGGRITSMKQLGLERAVRIDVAARDEMGHDTLFTLVCELMGKYSNVILLSSEGRILDALKRINPEQSRVRQVLPGMMYQDPPGGKISPLTASVATISDVIGDPLEKKLVDNIAGMSRIVATEIAERRGFAPLTPNKIASLARFVKDFAHDAVYQPTPCVYFSADKPVVFTPLRYEMYTGFTCVEFEDVNGCVDAYYTKKREYAMIKQKRDGLLKLVAKHRSRVAKKLKYQLDTLKEAENAEQHRINGELITANLYRIDRGDTQIEADNYYTGEVENIILDTTITPAANAQRCFKKYNKLNNARKIAVKLADEYEREVELLENTAYSLSIANDMEQLDEIRGELAKFGYVELKKNEKPRMSDPLAKPLVFVSSDGFRIFAGRNSRQNDALTMKVAHAEDMWFHARNIPGSHVILVTQGKEIPDNTLVETAVIAAVYSSAKGGGKADIDYCERKNVWKSKGAKPGLVHYENHKTISVPVDQNMIKKLTVED